MGTKDFRCAMHPRKEVSLSRRLIVLHDVLIPYDDSNSTFRCLELLNGSDLEAYDLPG